MKRARFIISELLMFAAVCAVLSLVCATNPELPVGETFGPWVWLGKSLYVATGCIAVAVLLQIWGKYGLQNILSYERFQRDVAWSLMLLGAVQAIWGLRQLYGFALSGHSLYAVTGSFYNPGPYGGYLALVLPICLYNYLRNNDGWKLLLWDERVGKVLPIVSGLLILCVLPATMSRSAWIAAFISCAWVFARSPRFCYKSNVLWRRYRKRYIRWGITIGIGAVLIGGVGLYHMKKDSALGRVFMWKMACHAVAETPFDEMDTPAAKYNEAQEAYFASGQQAAWEERVAGSPEHVFNEYLQLSLYFGWIISLLGLIAVILIWVIGEWMLYPKGGHGTCGAIVAFMVFAFASYPLQIPAFTVTIVMLILGCLPQSYPNFKWFAPLLLGVAMIWGVNASLQETMAGYRQWVHARMLYKMGAYEAAVKEYKGAKKTMRKEGAYLFEYGHCLHKMEKYAESHSVLREAENRTTDPMVLNIIGKNLQALRSYEEAESYFIRSTHRLPNRIYPYYLLAKLYAEPEFRNKEKFEKMKHIVLTKEPKVYSTAIREMRDELKKITWN